MDGVGSLNLNQEYVRIGDKMVPVGQANVAEKDEPVLDNENPFRLPKDESIFLARGKLKKKNSKTNNKSTIAKLRKPLRNKKKGSKVVVSERRREKENMSNFIAKKREMFLVQMSLDTKREEIRKLEEKAQMREQALLQSELMLEEDALRFDAFLKENDVKAHEAIKKHERETKEKQEKVAHVKRLNQEISKVRSEMMKYVESLEHCKKYKAFLDGLTAPEWFEEVEKKRKANQDAIAQYQHLKAEQDQRREAREQEGDVEDPENEYGDEEEDVESRTVSPPPPEVHESVDDMYFKQPEQLMQVFAALEERNLFLIQNTQETEEAYDELKQKFEEMKKEMEARSKALEESIAEMQDKIKTQENKAAELRERSKGLAESGAGDQQKLLEKLGERVSKVFSECGLDPEQTPGTLPKLRALEELLGHYVEKLEEMPDAERRKAEKKKEAERRERLRKEKILKTEREYEERVRRSLERSKRVEERVKRQKRGKPDMFRSAPIRKKKKKTSESDKKKLEAEEIFKKYMS